jgi:hypothetical protein
MMGRVSVLLLGSLAALFSPGEVAAQVGLPSGTAQVVLIARSAPRGAVDSIGAPSERLSSGSFREVSVPVRLSANTPFRLMAIRADVAKPGSGRVWVRDEKGEFQLLDRHSAVSVARGRKASGARELEVLYRLEVCDLEGVAPGPFIPVRYELAINPQL